MYRGSNQSALTAGVATRTNEYPLFGSVSVHATLVTPWADVHPAWAPTMKLEGRMAGAAWVGETPFTTVAELVGVELSPDAQKLRTSIAVDPVDTTT